MDPAEMGYSPIDRPPGLPPEVQPSTFNQLAGSAQSDTGVTAGDMQLKSMAAQLAMAAEMALNKLAQFVPGGTQQVAGIVSQIRQFAISAITGPSQGPSAAQGGGFGQLVSQGPPPEGGPMA